MVVVVVEVSEPTVGGSGLGIGFSTGLVNPSFISCTKESLRIIKIIKSKDIARKILCILKQLYPKTIITVYRYISVIFKK